MELAKITSRAAIHRSRSSPNWSPCLIEEADGGRSLRATALPSRMARPQSGWPPRKAWGDCPAGYRARPRARLMDFEIAAVDIFNEGLLMAPVSAIPRVLARHGLKFDDISLWEIHEAFSAQVLCHIKALEDKNFVREKAGVEHMFGSFPRDRMNPNGGSVALGHPFAATGARILSQALKELAALPNGSRAIVSICADGGLGTVALLES